MAVLVSQLVVRAVGPAPPTITRPLEPVLAALILRPECHRAVQPGARRRDIRRRVGVNRATSQKRNYGRNDCDATPSQPPKHQLPLCAPGRRIEAEPPPHDLTHRSTPIRDIKAVRRRRRPCAVPLLQSGGAPQGFLQSPSSVVVARSACGEQRGDTARQQERANYESMLHLSSLPVSSTALLTHVRRISLTVACRRLRRTGGRPWLYPLCLRGPVDEAARRGPSRGGAERTLL